MNKKITITIRSLIISILVGVFALIGLYFIFSLNFKTLSDNNDQIIAVIGALGTLTGGVIGGLVAYFAAAYQVKKHSEQNERVANNTALSSLTLIYTELKYNQNLLQSFKQSFSDINSPVFSSISISEWDKCSVNITSQVELEMLSSLLKIYQKVRGIKYSNSGIGLEQIESIIKQIEPVIDQINLIIDS